MKYFFLIPILITACTITSNNENNNAQIIFIVVGLALAILAPLIAQLIKLSISRKREFAADANAVTLTRYPQGLANALKVDSYIGGWVGSTGVYLCDGHKFEAFLPSILDEFYLVESFLPLQFQFQKEHVILCKEVWLKIVYTLKENSQY